MRDRVIHAAAVTDICFARARKSPSTWPRAVPPPVRHAVSVDVETVIAGGRDKTRTVRISVFVWSACFPARVVPLRRERSGTSNDDSPVSVHDRLARLSVSNATIPARPRKRYICARARRDVAKTLW